jgi:hypothetical protein
MQGLDAYYDGLLAEYQRKIDEQARLEEEAEDETQGEEDES